MVFVNPPEPYRKPHIIASGSFDLTPRRAMNTIIPDHPRRTVQIVEWFRPLEYLPHHMQSVTIVYMDPDGDSWTALGCAFDREQMRWFDVDADGSTTQIDGRVIWWTDDIDGPDIPDDVEA